ncbi:MAG: hypothetical protein COT26_01240, partial [Candidatus Kerfeldbacteria bacterium CG08_land_8_20_14_0_20_43_14]
PRMQRSGIRGVGHSSKSAYYFPQHSPPRLPCLRQCHGGQVWLCGYTFLSPDAGMAARRLPDMPSRRADTSSGDPPPTRYTTRSGREAGGSRPRLVYKKIPSDLEIWSW